MTTTHSDGLPTNRHNPQIGVHPWVRSRPRRAAHSDEGFTLIEIIVAIFLFSLLAVVLMTGVIAIRNATTASKQLTNINEQARVAIERMTRELRQAENIRSVTLPTTPGGNFAMTFEVDFNDNGVIDTATSDPEVLTYRYDAATQRLTLTANDESGTAITRPILASNVTAFSLAFTSSLWQHDINGDGITTWQEIDTRAGNSNSILDSGELPRIDIVAVSITLLDGPRTQTYATKVGLRNRAQS